MLRAAAGAAWAAAAGTAAAGKRVPKTVSAALLAVAAAATAAVLSEQAAERQGNRLTEVVLARLEISGILDGPPLRGETGLPSERSAGLASGDGRSGFA